MIIEHKWHASSESDELMQNPNEDLVCLAGKWSSQIQVTISSPEVIHKGPVKQHLDSNRENNSWKHDCSLSI